MMVYLVKTNTLRGLEGVMLTKGAIGNLVNRYRAVLKKCHLINVFGSLAVAGMMVMGGAGAAGAAAVSSDTDLVMTTPLMTENNGTYDDVNVKGNIIVDAQSGKFGVIGQNSSGSDVYSALDIKAGNVTADGYIKAGEITTFGNLTADHIETFRNADNTLDNNQGSVKIWGAVNLPGDSVTQRRFDLENTVGSHNVLGNVTTGACMGLIGNGTEKSTLTGGVMTIQGGTFAVARGMQATLKEVSFNIPARRARVHGENPNAATILDLDKLIVYDGVLITESRWDSQYALAAVRELSPDDSKEGVLIGDGHIAVGTNAVIGLGEGATLDNIYGLMKTFTGYETPTQDGVRSALILDQPLELQDGIDSSYNPTPGDSFNVYISADKYTSVQPSPYTTVNGEVSELADAMFAAGSFTQEADTLLVVNGANDYVHYTTVAKAAVPGAISYAGGSADALVEDGAKLAITGAQAGETYVILGNGFDANSITFGETAWTGDNLLTDNPLVSLSRGDDGTVAGEAVAAAQALPGLDGSVAAAMDSANLAHQIGTGGAYYDGGEQGTQFLSRALRTANGISGYGDVSTAVDAINEVSRASVTAGVQNTSLRLADAASDTVLHHLSLGNFDSGNSIHQDGLDIWATPMYGNTYTHGMGASGASVRGNYGGIALGVDTQVGELAGGSVRMGAALNGGGGKSETRGTATSTENEYNFGGVNLYAGWNLDSLNILASVGYHMGSHDVTMSLPASFGMRHADADVDTGAFTADLRAEYQIRTSWLDILPHAGVRYTGLHTDSYNLKVNGSTLNNVKSDTQNIVQFPIGVTVTKNIEVAGWNVKPQADVSVIPAAGDKNANTRVKFSGIDAWSDMNTRIMDSTSWAGMVGVQAEKGNLAFGLNYGVQASRHETDQRVNVGISWKF